MLVVLTTTPTLDEAETLADRLVSRRLAACVQILPRMTSVYFWQGTIQKDEEHLLLIKTTRERYSELETFISESHSYDVPEIAAIESAEVSPKYLEWLMGCVSDKAS